jgi:hypothetical protein
VITKDTFDGRPVFLGFSNYSTSLNDAGEIIPPKMRDYLVPTTLQERQYLDRVFSAATAEPLFSAADGNYKLYYPFSKDGKVVVLLFSDYQRYGKMGS